MKSQTKKKKKKAKLKSIYWSLDYARYYTVDTSEFFSIVYTNGFLVFNERFAVRYLKDKLRLDNTRLQYRLNRNKDFNYNVRTCSFKDDIPDISDLLITVTEDWVPLKRVPFRTDSKSDPYRLFYNEQQHYYTSIRELYFNIVRECDLLGGFYQHNKETLIYVPGSYGFVHAFFIPEEVEKYYKSWLKD